MYLRAYVDLPLDFEEVRDALLDGCPPSCLEGAAEAAVEECRRLLGAAGLTGAGAGVGHGPAWPTAVEADPAIATDLLTSLPLCLHAGETVLTRLATLDAGWLGPDRTHLSLSMSYDAPEPGSARQDARSRLRERVLLHRVHEAVALRFVDAVASRLMAGAFPLRTAEAV